jgi:hypothetical protein
MKYKKKIDLFIPLCMLTCLICFTGGFLFSALLAKKTQHKKEGKQIEYKCKLEGISQKIINNTGLSLELLEKTSKVWHAALKNNANLQNALGDFMRENKSQYETLQTNQTLIEIDINDFKNDLGAHQDTSNILMELYAIYKNSYQLNGNKNLPLEALDSQIHDLRSEFKTLVKNLKIYVPALQSYDLTDETIPSSNNIEVSKIMPSESKENQLKVAGPAPELKETSLTGQTINTSPNGPNSQTILLKTPQSSAEEAESGQIAQIDSPVNITHLKQQPDQIPGVPTTAPQIKSAEETGKFKMLSANMGFTQVERLLGVPLVKNKLQTNKEVWLYPSLKSGFQYQVIFMDTKFLKWKQVPLKTNRE